MNLQPEPSRSPSLAEQGAARLIAPAAHGQAHDLGDEDHEDPFAWAEMARIGAVALAAASVWFRWWEPAPSLSLVGVAGLVVGGWPIFKEAYENLLAIEGTYQK